MKNNLRNVVFTTMIGLCTFQIGKIVQDNETRKITESYVIRTESGEMLGYNIAILDDERLFTYED